MLRSHPGDIGALSHTDNSGMLSRQEAAALRKSLENETIVVVVIVADVDTPGATVVVTYTVLLQPVTDNNPKRTTAPIRFMQQTLPT